MNEFKERPKRKKKSKTQKSKTTNEKFKQQQQQQHLQKRKIQLTQEFEDNEKEVTTLLENNSLFSESSNNSHRDDDNKSPSERFFCGTKEDGNKWRGSTIKTDLKFQTQSGDINSDDTDVGEERFSKESTDDISTTTRSLQPTLASTFIQIEEDSLQSLVKVDNVKIFRNQSEFIYKPKMVLDSKLTSLALNSRYDTNLILQLNRLLNEFKKGKRKLDVNIIKAIVNSKNLKTLFSSDILYKTYCDFKFKPIFVEPSRDCLAIPSKKLLSLHIKDLFFTEHPDLQQEHRVANNLEMLCEHRQQRLQEKITEKLYADLQIERNILNELLRSAENGPKSERHIHKEKKAFRIEQHLQKVKALREKLYDEEQTNKQLLQDILNNWKKLKNLRKEQVEQFTRLKLRIKIENLAAAEQKTRLKLWSQRFEADLNEIYREQLEEYYRTKRLWLQRKTLEEYISKPHKPDIVQISADLRETFAKCFLNPKEPRVDVIRISSQDLEFSDLPGPRKLQSFYMRIFFDRQMVGETRSYRLERDLSVNINEKLGIMLNRRLPKDIRIKLYKKSKLSSAQKIANIIVPLPLPCTIEEETRIIAITFSSHKQPISGYLRINLQSDEQFYTQDIIDKLFPAPQQHTSIPKNMLKDWYQRKLLAQPEEYLQEDIPLNSISETEDDTEKDQQSLKKTCTFQEDLLQFCDLSELDNNRRLKVLHSRFTKTDARTRDLKFIPMLDHELEFDWETEESVIDPGNWMDPIDLHKHEGKKYLRNLYTAIQNQCKRLTKVVESRENLLLNDEPISWSAFFQTIKLIFQPRLNTNLNRTLSISSNAPTLSMEYLQNFKIICNIVRGTGIPVRINDPNESDNQAGNSPAASNVFVLQNLKYSNVRPFIAVSYKNKFCRTMTAEGSNPTWNEQLILQLSGSLSELHDDLRICLYDEVVENQINDEPGIKNVDIYQRVQNNWLGEYRIPINAIITQKKIDSVFELTAPKVIIGYKRPCLENVSSNAETNIMIEQFPEIKEAVRLWCYITIEPEHDLISINTKCLECSELIEVRQYLNYWSLQAFEMHAQRFMEPLICTADGKRLCITRILQPLPPPIEASENLLDSACRFVALLSQPKFYDPCMGFSGIWLNNELLLDTTWGSFKDLGVLLCNYLLYMGLQCWLVLGIAHPYGECTFVLYSTEDMEMFFIDPCKGKRYTTKDVFCPLQKIKMVVSVNNFYLNIQSESRVSMMNFNWNDSSCWLAGFSKKNPAPLGGFQSPNYTYRTSYNVSELKYNIERKIMKKISAWRNMRKTIWNRAFQPRLLTILQGMEQSVTFGGGSSYEELKYNNMLAAEFPNHKEHAKCKICGKWLVFKGTTSSLLYHLTKVHHIVMDEEQSAQYPGTTTSNSESEESNSSVESNGYGNKKQRLNPTIVEQINDAVVKMIAQEMLPLSFTDKKGFKNFMDVVAPGYNICGRKAVTGKISKLYSEATNKLTVMLKNTSTVSITTDAWTSTAVESYVTITVHFISDDWELKSDVLETFEHPENHTAVNLRSSLERHIQKWNLTGKVQATVHDNARNITAAVRDSYDLGQGVPCFAHTLQLAINGALCHAKDLIDKCVKIVGHFRHSTIETAALSKKQKELFVPEHKLEQSCKTRWNSTFKMMKRLIEQKPAINAVFQESSSSGLMQLSEEDWTEMEGIVRVLEAFDVATTLMSSQSKVTLSMVRPLIFRMNQNFLQNLSSDSVLISQIKKAVSKDLQVRFMDKTSSDIEPTCSLLAEILDPRYKNLSFETNNVKSLVISKITQCLESTEEPEDQNLAPSCEETALNFLFFGTKNPSRDMGTSRFEELQSYLQEPECSLHINPLSWWRDNCGRYPNISKLAKKYLTIPATSVPSERVFSTAGDIITAERSRLSSENASMLIFLSENDSLY